jgi:hypothetical protein
VARNALVAGPAVGPPVAVAVLLAQNRKARFVLEVEADVYLPAFSVQGARLDGFLRALAHDAGPGRVGTRQRDGSQQRERLAARDAFLRTADREPRDELVATLLLLGEPPLQHAAPLGGELGFQRDLRGGVRARARRGDPG